MFYEIMNKNDRCEKCSKFNQESDQKRKTVFEIAYLLASNFRNKLDQIPAKCYANVFEKC